MREWRTLPGIRFPISLAQTFAIRDDCLAASSKRIGLVPHLDIILRQTGVGKSTLIETLATQDLHVRAEASRS